jgi:hypothetical protein
VACFWYCHARDWWPCLCDVVSPLGMIGLTLHWRQRRLPLEFMDGLSYTTIIEFAEPPARRRGSALDR